MDRKIHLQVDRPLLHDAGENLVSLIIFFGNHPLKNFENF